MRKSKLVKQEKIMKVIIGGALPDSGKIARFAGKDPNQEIPFAEETVRPGCAAAMAGIAVLVICICVAFGVSA